MVNKGNHPQMALIQIIVFYYNYYDFYYYYHLPIYIYIPTTCLFNRETCPPGERLVRDLVGLQQRGECCPLFAVLGHCLGVLLPIPGLTLAKCGKAQAQVECFLTVAGMKRFL